MRLFMLQLRVDDWAGSVAWYRDALGLKLLMQDELGRFALLDAGGTKLAIKAREAGSSANPSDSSLERFPLGCAGLAETGTSTSKTRSQSPFPPDRHGEKKIALVFQVDDLDAERERLNRFGVAVGPVLENQAEGFRECGFADPEGNMVKVFTWR